MKKIGLLELEGMEFKAFHGCLERERVAGNDFIVDFRGELEMDKAAQSDELDDALNYAGIHAIIKREMDIPSDLLENVAGRIVKALEEEFPQLIKFSVRVSKRRPPVDGVMQWSRVTMYHENI